MDAQERRHCPRYQLRYPIIVSSSRAINCAEGWHFGEILDAGRNGIRLRVNNFGTLRVGMKLMREYAFRAILITRGESGMSLFEREGGIRHTAFPAQAREVYDVTGAGDTVIGVLALCLAAGGSFREAAYLANHAAGIVVGKVGTATVSREELKKVL